MLYNYMPYVLKEEERNVLFKDALNTFYLVYGVMTYGNRSFR